MNDLYKSDLDTTADAPEVIYVSERRIACNGGGGALGHPVVYYALDDGEAECGYCDRKFIYDPARAGAPR
ncbi:MAG: zinc-finger domain-containing protein [Pseudomonadota bacterium]